ncbi:MAG: DUF1003 domain-containing protein [Oligoflexia bacterium]|nr:DUF1003 domain-containing protein [Oligoflexia bacterium]
MDAVIKAEILENNQVSPAPDEPAAMDPLVLPLRPSEEEQRIDEELELLKGVPLFANLDPIELRALHAAMDRREIVPGESVSEDFAYRPGFHIIVKGRVEFLAKDAQGHTVSVSSAEPGDYFGELSILSNDPAPFIARATEETITLELEPQEFEDFMAANPHAAVDVLRVLAKRIGQTERLMREHVSRDPNVVAEQQRSFGQRVADGVAQVVGSWKFVLAQSSLIAGWFIYNSLPGVPHFDPFPFIFLNLALSMQAAYTGPMLQMSSNRQAAKDRVAASNDHQVNLKAELIAEALLKRVASLDRKLGMLEAKLGKGGTVHAGS